MDKENDVQFDSTEEHVEESTPEVAESNETESNDEDDFDFKAAYGRTKRELTKLQKELEAKESKKEEEQKPTASAPDDFSKRLWLKTDGIKSKKEQDLVIEYADKFGIDLDEALSRPGVQAELEEIRRKRSVQEAAPRSGGGAPASKKGPEYYIKKGELPRDPEMLEKVQNELARRAKHNY